jgi:hypothetical protein
MTNSTDSGFSYNVSATSSSWLVSRALQKLNKKNRKKDTKHHNPSRHTSGIILDNQHSHRRQQALTTKQLIGKTN